MKDKSKTHFFADDDRSCVLRHFEVLFGAASRAAQRTATSESADPSTATRIPYLVVDSDI
jgi:hypothetical protein